MQCFAHGSSVLFTSISHLTNFLFFFLSSQHDIQKLTPSRNTIYHMLGRKPAKFDKDAVAVPSDSPSRLRCPFNYIVLARMPIHTTK